MQAFRAGQKPATVMDRIAKGFTDDEIKAIAAWYAAQNRLARLGPWHTLAGDNSSRSEPRPGRCCPLPALAQGSGRRVVVIGGGFAGATCARFIKKAQSQPGGDTGRNEPHLYRLPFQQRGHRWDCAI